MAMFYDENVSTHVRLEDDDYNCTVDVTVPMPINEWEALHAYCRTIYKNGNKVNAIKVLRKITGLGLRNSKLLCEHRGNSETTW